ncbi:cell envelope integrity protein TolA [Enterobacter sp.]|uniref:cell envelope integrity protein TolA n=1 Tax=Enterobacter sp. TaxID=42895 RepID=UPI00296EBB52|nr:cell envelope integrity protein TolA [Enterobacter sp.]
MKKLIIAVSLIISLGVQAQKNENLFSAAMGQMVVLDKINNTANTIYTCDGVAENGFITPDAISYVQSHINIDKINAVYIGTLIGGTVTTQGDIFLYKTTQDLKGGVYDMTKQATIQINDGGDFLNVTMKSAKAEEKFRCALDEDATKQSAVKAAHQKALVAKETKKMQTNTSGVDDLLDDLGSGKSAPKKEASPTTKKETSSVSGADISSYVNEIIQKFRSKLNFDDFQGKECQVRIFFTRNGAITNFSQEGGDETFCNYVTSAINGMDRLPVPPSDAVYNTINGATLNLKPN